MVQLQEIVDEHFMEGQPGPEEDDADYTDTGTSRCNAHRPTFSSSHIVNAVAPV
jgi:hypothetical protein